MYKLDFFLYVNHVYNVTSHLKLVCVLPFFIFFEIGPRNLTCMPICGAILFTGFFDCQMTKYTQQQFMIVTAASNIINDYSSPEL